MKLETPRLPVKNVIDGPSLEMLLDKLNSTSEIGLDAERASGFRYSNRAYLIQIATTDSIYLVDPVPLEAEPGWSARLASAMEPPTWILHSATQDLPCLAELGIRPKIIIDTELAARLVGIERFGLASLAEQLLGLELAKEHSAADWSKRPLSESMLNYAALDVDILFEIWRALSQRAAELGRESWLAQEFAQLIHFQPKSAAAEPWRNLPRMSKVRDVNRQKIAASLWQVRDKIAREQDVAPGRLIPDRSIAAVVAKPPRTKRELAGNKEFQGRASRSMLEQWWRAIEQSQEIEIGEPVLDPNHIPNHRSWEKRFPEAHIRLKEVRAGLQEKAEEFEIAVELLITPDTLRRVCFTPEEDLAAQLQNLKVRAWQLELVLPIIQAGLERARAQSA